MTSRKTHRVLLLLLPHAPILARGLLQNGNSRRRVIGGFASPAACRSLWNPVGPLPHGGRERCSVAEGQGRLHESSRYDGEEDMSSWWSDPSDGRRSFFVRASAPLWTTMLTSNGDPAAALPFLGSGPSEKQSSTFVLLDNRNSTLAPNIPDTTGLTESSTESAETYLLKLLPVRKPVFRTLQSELETLSGLGDRADDGTWKSASRTCQQALRFLDNQRGQLQPAFNQDDTTEMQILKGIRGERLIETLRDAIVTLQDNISDRNEELAEATRKRALLALAEIGELLVETFPYSVPTYAKFSYLPRLLGRARVTFTISRPKTEGNDKESVVLGNVTLIADGFAAPITAGNFVDLSLRNFYTGLPVKFLKKKLSLTLSSKSDAADMVATALSMSLPGLGAALRGDGEGDDEDDDDEEVEISTTMSATFPVLGSFQEGFYDPLTARPRRLPLELVQVNKATGAAELSYASGFTDYTKGSAVATKPSRSSSAATPVLSFDTPGIVAMNHPDRNVHGGSSEFFVLRPKDISPKKALLMDGQYAPFGYVIEGYEIIAGLKAGDFIESTTVDDWGMLNLVKVRGTSFTDILQSNQKEEE